MKRSDSKKLVITWQKRKGINENDINLKDTLKSFPKSSG
jgi:succinate dehydrogenase flavin-adding protein (antitoxin of CptAB toxin-antitoxin module)